MLPPFKVLILLQVKDKLGLSYKDSRTLHQLIDKLPERAGPWRERILTFEDRDEEFIIRYRNSLEAVKALIGDPTLSTDMTYSPQKVFSLQDDHEERLISEMWTADWWWEVQVFTFHSEISMKLTTLF